MLRKSSVFLGPYTASDLLTNPAVEPLRGLKEDVCFLYGREKV